MCKRRISLIIVIAMLLSLIPFSAATAEAEGGPVYTFNTSEGHVTIEDGTNAGTYKVLYGNPQVEMDNIPQSQLITLFGTTATANNISVTATDGTVKICLKGLEVSGGMNLSSSLNRNVEILLADKSANIIRNSLYNDSPAKGGAT